MKSKSDSTKVNRSILIFSIFLLFSCSKADILVNDSRVVGSPKNSTNQETPSDTTATDSIPLNGSNDSVPSDTPQDAVSPIYDRTTVSLRGDRFLINGKLTYEGRQWQGNTIEGLLFNSRMVQGVFDDLNPDTAPLFAYPDTKRWDPDRNTDEFVASMSQWKSQGLLAFTLNLQGGSPTGYGNAKPWTNSAFDEKGQLRSAYMNRLQRILDEADRLQMVVILGYFYFGQDQLLQNETAVLHAVDNMTHWILENGYRNLIVEINNECDNYYDHDILRPGRVSELIRRVKATKNNGFRLLVSTSFTGGTVPNASVVQASDIILLHANGIGSPSGISDLVAATRGVSGYVSQPIVLNEDDHYNFESANNNLVAAVRSYASWGYFDFRRQGEGFESGYQSVPVDWGINSERKRSFFSKLREITGY